MPNIAFTTGDNLPKGKKFVKEVSMYKKILAPLDGSQFSECSLEHVKAIATGCHVPEVVLLRVVELPQQLYEVYPDWLRDTHQKAHAGAKDYLATVADNLKKEGIAVQTAVSQGRPEDEILDYAKKNQIDLIIMSTHGKSGVSRWVMGSIADRVVHHSTVPVLIVSPPGCRRQ